MNNFIEQKTEKDDLILKVLLIQKVKQVVTYVNGSRTDRVPCTNLLTRSLTR